ncbi:MAG: ATP-binding cassette domain-containing protein [Bacteroidota bacterium]
MTIVSTQNLTKKYRRLTALNRLNFEIQQGMVFGLLGPNGSGKTTTLGMLLNVIAPTSGTFQWFEKPPSAESRQQIGAILETPCFYPYMTAVQNLEVIVAIKNCALTAIEEVLHTVGLFERRNDPFKTYSLGMKQRLAIGAALLANPPVLILDEPTNGLDPQGIAEIRRLIQDIAKSGKTIILASHLLDEVQKVCTDFMVLRKGEKLFQGNVKTALSDQRTIEVSSENMEQLQRTLADHSGITQCQLEAGKCVLNVLPSVRPIDVSRYLFDKKIVVTHLAEQSGSLEKQFLKILAET